jgi:hypothetical protein
MKSDTTQPDGLREILRQLAVDGSSDTMWTIDGNAQKIVDKAEAAIRQYFAGKLPEKLYEPDDTEYPHEFAKAHSYNQALDDCRRAIEGKQNVQAS